jgi:hypothetical protein
LGTPGGPKSRRRPVFEPCRRDHRRGYRSQVPEMISTR